MTDAVIDNVLYQHLKKSLNNALPLEYAIRGVNQVAPGEMKALKDLNDALKEEWLSRGVSETEIVAEDLLDFSWDSLQVGMPLARTHGRVYLDAKFVSLMNETLRLITEKYQSQVESLDVPLSDRFRYCDLLNGNQIPQLLKKIAICLGAAKQYEACDSVPFSKFIRDIREPILLYPGAKFSHSADGNPDQMGFMLMLDFKMEYAEIKYAIEEYLYQYAKFRESLEIGSFSSDTTGRLLGEFLKKDFSGRLRKGEITRHDGFISILSGLYCWDRYVFYKAKQVKGAMDTAVDETLAMLNDADVPKENYDEAVKKNYKKVKKKIDQLLALDA